ncbi:NUDIX hydrolase [Candidatus Pacearchaeota archaeon]|nr:NUDIX hydrolase [Candidatus Pacearchaeota archaeon]
MEKIKYNTEDLKDHQGVSAVIRDNSGDILMQEHTKYGFWTIPVGKVDLDKDAEKGMKLEVFEETNLVVKECKEIGYKLYEYARNGRSVKVYTHMFEIKKYAGKLENKEPNKHKKQMFMSINEIIKLPYLSDTTLWFLSTLGISREPKTY